MKRRLYVLGALVAVLLGIRAALPAVMQAVIESQGTNALGRPVSVANVDLALHSGTLTVEGLDIGGSEAPRIQCERILANLHFLNLLRGRAQLEELAIGRAKIALALLPGGQLAPLVLAVDPGEPGDAKTITTAAVDTSEPDPEPGDAWPLAIDHLAIADFSLLLVTPAAPDLPPLELNLEDFHFKDFSFVDGQLAFGSIGLKGSHARVRRDLTFEPRPESGEETPPAAPAPPSGTRPRLFLGDLAIEDARFTLELGEDQLELAVSVNAQNVRLDADSRFPLEIRVERDTGWLRLEGEAGANPPAFGGELTLERLTLANVIALIDPSLPLRIKKGLLGGELDLQLALGATGPSIQLGGSLRAEAVEGVAEGRSLEIGKTRLDFTGVAVVPTDEGPSRVSADSVVLGAEGVSFHDETVEPSFPLELLTLDASAKGVQWPDRDAEIRLTAKGLGGLAVSAEGALDDGTGRTDLSLENLHLAALSGYAKGAGLRFEGGTASLRGDIASDGPLHDLTLDLVLTDLQVGDIDPGVFQQSFGMTPDLALGILSDPTGSVDLPIRFAIDTRSGETGLSLRHLLAGAVSQALMGIVTSPLKGLGLAKDAILGDEGDLVLEPVAFEPGKRRWADGEEVYLDALARSLEARPTIRIRLTGQMGDDESERLARSRAERVASALKQRGVAEGSLEVAEPTSGTPGVAVALLPRAADGTN
jgi:hypothetical protein